MIPPYLLHLGLTAAIELHREARQRGMLLMVGCMVCTSLSIAPAAMLARHADFVDLDGPLWLKSDHPGGAALPGAGARGSGARAPGARGRAPTAP
ncbi:MAG: hypothetical protein KY449_05655 [Proteobacteria bacterium]|nr:hypothetical protein [Pseudomonadota bacterium]